MKTDPTFLLICGLCLYPFFIFGLPAYLVGRYWGKVKLRSPLTVQKSQPVTAKPKPTAPQSPTGFGK